MFCIAATSSSSAERAPAWLNWANWPSARGHPGLPVQIRIEGEQRPLSPALDLVSFRIVQEALTNAIKHAGPARARVRVTFAADGLELEITDTGEGTARSRAGTEPVGHGLIGMQERLTLYGGHLQTGWRRGGGFLVVARIPLTEPALT